MKSFILILLAFFLTPAWAHSENNLSPINDFIAGFVHPFSGIDHLLFMFSLGLYASRYKGRASPGILGLFLIFLALGTYLANLNLSLPNAETGIVLSLFGAGILPVSNKIPKNAIIFPFVAYFALCHGYSHAIEMNFENVVNRYFAGFLSSTLLILCLGRLTGRLTVTKGHYLRNVTGIASLALGTLVLAN
jgi:urease accessory protein